MPDVKRNIVFIVYLLKNSGSSSGVVVKLFACRARSLRLDSRPTPTTSEIDYLLFPNRDMAEISLKQHKSLKQPTSK